MTDRLDFERSYISHMGELLCSNPDSAVCGLSAVFITVYGMMTVEQRFRIMKILSEITLQIGKENFEDGEDFVEFIQEVGREKFYGNSESNH